MNLHVLDIETQGGSMHVVEPINATSLNESIESGEHAAPTQVTDNEQENANVQEDPVKQLVLTDDTLASEIISSLKANDMKSIKWVNSSTTTLIEVVLSLDSLKSLRHTDLNVIYSCLEKKLNRKYKLFQKSWKK
jgi:hypothetical protein